MAGHREQIGRGALLTKTEGSHGDGRDLHMSRRRSSTCIVVAGECDGDIRGRTQLCIFKRKDRGQLLVSVRDAGARMDGRKKQAPFHVEQQQRRLQS